MHVLYDQIDMNFVEPIVRIHDVTLFYVKAIYLGSQHNIDLLNETTPVFKVSQAEYSGKFRRAYKNEGLKDE